MGDKLRSEFNMGALDQERLHELSKKADEFAFYVIAGDMSFLDEYLSALRGVYRILKSIRGEIPMQEYEEEFNKILELRSRVNNQPRPMKKDVNDLINKLDYFHYKIYRFKQMLGLGIPVFKVRSRKRMMEEALGAVNPR